MGSGAQYVITIGMLEMLKLCVDNFSMMDVNLNLLPIPLLNIFFPPASYPLLAHYSRNRRSYHIDSVNCDGNENRLSDCSHGGIGIHECSVLSPEVAGAVCTGVLVSVWPAMACSAVDIH